MDSKFNIMGIEPGYKDYKGIEMILKFYKNNGDDFLAAKTIPTSAIPYPSIAHAAG